MLRYLVMVSVQSYLSGMVGARYIADNLLFGIIGWALRQHLTKRSSISNPR